jgi:carbon storage regulator CsrA
MLVLTRHVGQTICIGPEVRITVMKIKGSSTISIGIDAPRVDRSQTRKGRAQNLAADSRDW